MQPQDFLLLGVTDGATLESEYTHPLVVLCILHSGPEAGTCDGLRVWESGKLALRANMYYVFCILASVFVHFFFAVTNQDVQTATERNSHTGPCNSGYSYESGRSDCNRNKRPHWPMQERLHLSRMHV